MNKQEQEALDKVKPICAQCKYYRADSIFPKCSRAVSYSADRVSGKVTEHVRLCDTERASINKDRCGFRGRFYEEAPEVPQTWFNKVTAWVANLFSNME